MSEELSKHNDVMFDQEKRKFIQSNENIEINR